MREILFKGLEVDTKEWVYGYLVKINKECYIFEDCEWDSGVSLEKVIETDAPYEKVIPETVGQYTGLKDKKRVRIFGGDRVTVPNEDGGINHLIVKFGTVNRDMKSGWNVDITGFYFEINGFCAFPITRNWQNKHDLDDMEIIGNIHEESK